VFNILLLNQSPEKYSTNKLFDIIPYKYIYIGIFTILLLLDVYDFRKTINQHNNLWLMVLLLVAFIIHNASGYKTVDKDETLNIPPAEIKTKNKRIQFIIIAIFIAISIAIFSAKIGIPVSNDIYFIRSILLLFLLYNTITYRSCNYNLPVSWNN
jgi:hypothetical protein